MAQRRVAELEIENSRLKGQIRSLVGRVSELETSLQTTSQSVAQTTQPVDPSKSTADSHGKVDSIPIADNMTSVVPSPVVEANSQQQHIESATSDVVSHSSRTSSNSSDSVVVVESHTSDTMSFADESSAHGLASESDGLASSIAGGASSLSAQTNQFLSAVDDEEDDEENGWN
jgi:hypothetical protein